MAKAPVFLAKKMSQHLLQNESRSFRIGMRKSEQPAYQIRLDEKGKLDEVVATPEWVHLEQMDWGHWWLGIETAGGNLIHVHLTSKKKIEATVYEDSVPRRAEARPNGSSGTKP